MCVTTAFSTHQRPRPSPSRSPTLARLVSREARGTRRVRTSEREMESVWCHDCARRVHVAAAALDQGSRDAKCPSCDGIFLERAESSSAAAPARGQRTGISVVFGPAFVAHGDGAFGDFDFTQLDTRNFDAPCDARAVEALPERAWDGGDEKTCSVCLSEFARGDRVKTIPKCSHEFHLNCLTEWLKLRDTCPVCRCKVCDDGVATTTTA